MQHTGSKSAEPMWEALFGELGYLIHRSAFHSSVAKMTFDSVFVICFYPSHILNGRQGVTIKTLESSFQFQ